VHNSDEMAEITEEEIRTTSDPTLIADPAKGNEGILDHEEPEFATLEAEAAEDVVLAEDVVDDEGVIEEEGAEMSSR
jgi:hypothetical protein